jgi:hypothetical protein
MPCRLEVTKALEFTAHTDIITKVNIGKCKDLTVVFEYYDALETYSRI